MIFVKKKIMIFFLIIFLVLFLLAYFFFWQSKRDFGKEEVQQQIDIRNTDSKTLIRYNLGLYAIATDDYIIEGDILVNYGTISKLTDGIPTIDLQTNDNNFLNASIVRVSYEELVVKNKDYFYKFYRVGD